MSITPLVFLFHKLLRHELPIFEQSSGRLKQPQTNSPFGGNKGLRQSTSLNKAQTVQPGSLFTLIETTSNKSYHLVMKRVNTEHIAKQFQKH